LAKVTLRILGDSSSLERAFARAAASSRRFGSTIGSSNRHTSLATRAHDRLRSSIGLAATEILGGAGLIYAFKSTVEAASRIQEETEKTGVVFGKEAKRVQTWAGTLSAAFGIGEGSALEFAGKFGNIMRPLGFTEKSAAKMSTRLVELSADMASFNNAKPQDVLEALQSGLAGQVRPLRQFGVFLSDAREKAEAFRLGIYNGKGPLTAQQKLLASYNIILRDTKLQQGDVARNTGSLSVAQSKLSAAIEDTQANVARALLPTLVKYTNQAAHWLGQTRNQQSIQRGVNQALRTAKTVIQGVSQVLRVLLAIVRPINRALGGTKHTTELLTAAFIAFKLRGVVSLVTGVGTAIRALAKLTAAEEAASVAGGGLTGGKIGKAGKLGRIASAALKAGPLVAGGALLAADAAFLIKAFRSDQGKKVGTNTAGVNVVRAQNGLFYNAGAPGRVGGHTLFTGRLPDGRRVDHGRLVSGGGNIVVNVNGAGDSDAVARRVVNLIQKKAKRTAPQKRGKLGGTALGTG